MHLAEQCSHLECFAHISTTFSLCDKLGFIDEKYQESSTNWEEDFQKIMSMTNSQILENTTQIIGKFPNSYCYSKRMAEELLIKH